MMNPEIKEKWLEALRSGKYKQETGSLRTSNGFCCLGVLCDVVGASWDNQRALPEDKFIVYRATFETMQNTSMVPSSVRRIAKLDQYHEDTLANFNDIDKLSFEQIAEYIEKTL